MPCLQSSFALLSTMTDVRSYFKQFIKPLPKISTLKFARIYLHLVVAHLILFSLPPPKKGAKEDSGESKFDFFSFSLQENQYTKGCYFTKFWGLPTIELHKQGRGKWGPEEVRKRVSKCILLYCYCIYAWIYIYANIYICNTHNKCDKFIWKEKKSNTKQCATTLVPHCPPKIDSIQQYIAILYFY